MILAVEMQKLPVIPRKMADAEEEYFHTSPKCKGCAYGRHQYCIGVCWKDIFDRRRRKSRYGEE